MGSAKTALGQRHKIPHSLPSLGLLRLQHAQSQMPGGAGMGKIIKPISHAIARQFTPTPGFRSARIAAISSAAMQKCRTRSGDRDNPLGTAFGESPVTRKLAPVDSFLDYRLIAET